MPRASTVSEKVWAQAIHAVTVQKMSLRRAAQLYGVHHMSLHRRVRGRYMTNPPSRYVDDFRLTAAEEEEALIVLREQFEHEGDVSPDDVRYVVRTIASNDGQREIPNDFPLHRWISNFRRVHGLIGETSPRAITTPPTPPRAQQPPMVSPASSTRTMPSHSYTIKPSASSKSAPQPFNGLSILTSASMSSPHSSTTTTTATTSTSYQQHPGYYRRSDSNLSSSIDQEFVDSTSESESEHHHRDSTAIQSDSGKAPCKQSNMVSAETWEKAMDAVEIHGMSLRNAAKAYGVHFAALHRRVKKRALQKEQSPPLENYIPFEDEAGIVRVIHARADLGILMRFGELADLLDRTAAKYTVVTPELSRAIVRRFQSRVEHSIRHLIQDWPLPHVESLYRYQSNGGSPMGDEKMSSPPMPPHLPALFPPRANGQHMQAEAKSAMASRHVHEAYNSSAGTYFHHAHHDDGNATPMEIERSPRTSMLRL